MPLPPIFLRAQAATKTGRLYTLGRTATANRFALVTEKIGFPYLLDSVALVLGPNGSARVGLQLHISDDDDISDPTNLSGEPLWTWRGDQLAGEDPIPYQEYRKPSLWNPRRIVETAGTFIKARWHVTVIGESYNLYLSLVPL